MKLNLIFNFSNIRLQDIIRVKFNFEKKFNSKVRQNQCKHRNGRRRRKSAQNGNRLFEK